MKKLVIFTLAMVLVSSMAFAVANENAVALLGQAATTGGENTAIDAQGNPVAVNGSQAATNGGANFAVDDSLNNNKAAFNGGQIAGRDTNPDNRSNYNNDYIVDNAILANVNVAGLAFQPGLDQDGRISFRKTQESDVEGSFNHATGVSNVNSAAGNMNNQTAFTKISIGSIGGR